MAHVVKSTTNMYKTIIDKMVMVCYSENVLDHKNKQHKQKQTIEL
jgi:hypothetical protein